jgi:hypothetical protein
MKLNWNFHFDLSRLDALLDRPRSRPAPHPTGLSDESSKDIIDPTEKTMLANGAVQSRDALPPTLDLDSLRSDLMDSKNLHDVFSALNRFFDGIGQTSLSAASRGDAPKAMPMVDNRIGADAENGTPTTMPAITNLSGYAPAGSSDAATSVPTTTAATSSASDAGKDILVGGGGNNTIKVTNTSNRAQNYGLFTNPTAGMRSGWGVPNGFMGLQPGESANFKLGDQAGYVQQLNDYTQTDYDNRVAVSYKNNDNFKASRAEYNFTNFAGVGHGVWFNDSNIDGYNSALKMNVGTQEAGSATSILGTVRGTAPGLIKNVGGQDIVEGPQFFSNDTNYDSVRTLDKLINGSDDPNDIAHHKATYVMPNDDAAVRWATDDTLTLAFGNA